MSADQSAYTEAYFDTTSQRWYVKAQPMLGFTTKQDAINAMRLGGAMECAALDRLADKVLEVLP